MMKGQVLLGAVVLLLIQAPCGLAFFTTRRDVLNTAVVVPTAAVATTFGGAPPASAAQTTAEAIRRTAAGIPGYGQPDVYYPTSYLGRWRAKKTIVVSDNPYLASGLLPVTLNYEMRFISVDGDSKEETENAVGGKVVADRAFNEQSYYEALRNVVIVSSSNGGESSGRAPPALRSAIWVPTNPNVLSSTYDDGTSQEIKVTKRAATLGQDGDGTVSSSEYRRISDVGMNGIPILSASRVLTKWRSDGESVEAIEIVYADGVMGDPMGGAGGAVARQGAPVASSKSRISLQRIQQ
mmetsp:Transcript_16062/g.46121  ORF Transcript_16062/g.46121 Transcript_16062/m.46121 type:complete len:295 (+) Transcript_16062:32-916(+)